MVPPALPKREWIVSATGLLEIVGAILIVLPFTSGVAAIGLVILLIAMFPANIRAARERLTIGGKSVPPLGVRIILQLIFIAAILGASPLFF